MMVFLIYIFILCMLCVWSAGTCGHQRVICRSQFCPVSRFLSFNTQCQTQWALHTEPSCQHNFFLKIFIYFGVCVCGMHACACVCARACIYVHKDVGVPYHTCEDQRTILGVRPHFPPHSRQDLSWACSRPAGP